MSVRKRTWKSRDGSPSEAWVVDYVDQAGKRRLKTFTKKKAADNFAATASVEIRAGVHTADSASVTVAEAGRLWLETGEHAGLERSTLAAYRQHLKLHIEPYPRQHETVAALGADGPRVHGQARSRRHGRGRGFRASISRHGQKSAGLAIPAHQRRPGARARGAQRRS